MSKNGKDKKQPQVRQQIVITLFDDGNFQVSGPLHDHIMFYGLLEKARDSVLMQAGRQAQQRAKAESIKGSAPWWRRVFAPKPKDASRAVSVSSDESKAGGEALRGEGAGLPLPLQR